MPFVVAILETEPPPKHRIVANKVLELYGLGMCVTAIAKRLNVDPKTVKKALRWMQKI